MKTGEEVWVVGQIMENAVSPDEWELAGVFTEEFLAVEACRSDVYFIGPVKLNIPFPYERVEWEGSYYPKLQTRDRKFLIGEVNED